MAKFWLEDDKVKSDEPLNKFDTYQIEQIRYGLKNELDVSVYADQKFDDGQMEQIRVGLEKKLDTSVYIDTKFDGYQMMQIRLGLENRLDVSLYADLKFDGDQMQEIREGLEVGLDVSVYANPDIDNKEMNCIRHTMENRVIDAVVKDLEKHGTSVEPKEVDLCADGIYVEYQKITTINDLKILCPELEFNDLRESLFGQTTDDLEVDDEEESLDDE